MRKIITLIVAYQLIFSQAFLMASDIENIVRNDTIRDNMRNSSLPSNIPFLGYTESFHAEHVKLIDKHDLSQYEGKEVYVGYGIFDGGENYCKYVDLPNPPAQKIDVKFKDFKKFNNKTYGILRDGDVTYNSCKAIVESYGGIVATPLNRGDDSIIRSFKVDNWIGIFRSDCSQDYVSYTGETLNYSNWTALEDNSECENSELNAVQTTSMSWRKVSKNDTKKCIIEISSPFADRPIKFCAPWWRVERTYTKPENMNINGLNLFSINQADVPELYNVCTEMNSEAIAAIDNNETYEFQCTTYFDSTMGSECLESPMQPQCKVSECKGYVENACKHIRTVTPLKDYTKIIIQENGSEVSVKGKVNIRTQIYECPMVVPSNDDCIKKSSVVAYPKECPGSECDAKKECYSIATNSDDFLACDAKFSCEKIYPLIDRLPASEDLVNGELKFLRGECSDGTELRFPVNIQDKTDKICKLYSTIEETKEITEKCFSDRQFHDIVLNMSITNDDFYQDDPDCVRTNNIVDARPVRNVIFDISFNGLSENVISKITMPNNKNILNTVGQSTYIRNFAESRLIVRSENGSVIEDNSANSIGGCPLLDSGSEETVGSWMEYKLKPIFEKDLIQVRLNSTTVQISGTLDNSSCGLLADSIGGIKKSNDSNCRIERPSTAQDNIFYSIEAGVESGDENDPDRLLIYKSEVTTYNATQCNDWAICLNADGIIDAGGRCVATQIDTSLSNPEVEETTEELTDCKPPSGIDQVTSTINGLTDIFLIEDKIEGSWGYASNYFSTAHVSNVVSINGKEAFPIVQPSLISDQLDYLSKIQQGSITTKKPRILAGLLTGTDTGAALLYAEVLGGVVAVVVVLLVALFGKKRKYNEESVYWVLYKDIPKLFYIKGPYDNRIVSDMGSFMRVKYSIGGEDPGETPVFGWANFSGTLRSGGDFETFMANLFKRKQQTFACLGFDIAQTPRTNKELGYEVPGFPGCKWYHTSCNKYSIGPVEDYSTTLLKRMGGFFLGATNSISIVTPYIGDYEVEGYNQYGEILGTFIIKENDFINESDSTMAYAQVPFAQNMQLAEGMTDGAQDGACRDVQMVEFGGGVSGIYYENQDSGGVYNSACEKSQDNYVQDHSLTKIKIRPLNQEDFIDLELSLPMPYANRIKLVTMSTKEIRKYRCYLDFENCSEDDFIRDSEDN